MEGGDGGKEVAQLVLQGVPALSHHRLNHLLHHGFQVQGLYGLSDQQEGQPVHAKNEYKAQGRISEEEVQTWSRRVRRDRSW